MKKLVSLLLAAIMILSLAACNNNPTPSSNPSGGNTDTPDNTDEPVNLTATQQIIQQAQTMTLEELAQKAI